jgi:Glycosyl hydrolase family 45
MPRIPAWFGVVSFVASVSACTAPAGSTRGKGPDSGVVGTPDAASGSGGSTSGAGSGGSGTGNAGGDGNGGGGADNGTSGGSGGAPNVPAADMVDNLDDNDGRILQANGRQGPWHAFNDQNGGNQQPPVNGTFTPQTGGANSTAYAAHTTGSGLGFGGIGFDLNNGSTMPESSQSQAYNAGAFAGIRFWAKGNGNLRVELPQRSFVPPDRGGSCNGTCWNVYGSRALQGKLTATWQEFTIMFSALQREDGSMSPVFNPAELMGIAFKHEGSSFDFWIDEVQFIYAGNTGTGTGGRTGAGGSGGAGGVRTGGSSGTGAASATGGNSGTGGSAVPPPPPITGGSNGWASRYWDCCKPACGWQGNVRRGSPMHSCDKQNMSLGGNYDAKNACEGGGTAYMCWNASPWAVSDTLSYGFAAASGGNYVCGRCYQIQFTGSGHNGSNAGVSSLNGKTMIIQVINNGGVAADQFDLLIPGGGVGALNACSSQWGSSDLGAQYGGFLGGCNGDKNCVRQKCQTIFGDKPELMEGCDWFLGWFNAADNPNFVFKQVACPAAITSDSGLQDPG